MKIPTNNEAARETNTNSKITHKQGSKILILKETRTKQSTSRYVHTQTHGNRHGPVLTNPEITT
jgi:hypothetical protein